MFKYTATLVNPDSEYYELPGYCFEYNVPQEVPFIIADIVKNSIYFTVVEEMTPGLDDMKLVKDVADTPAEVEAVVEEEEKEVEEPVKVVRRHRKPSKTDQNPEPLAEPSQEDDQDNADEEEA